ncbi:filamentous hemagglutinin N-terminal domain-containing protein [Argonema antarcticum]|uniref:two-partner secretion domain-containing protein n=1 Tax=Argonema antarcticum TaxID=2942763 RepID=UPI002012EC4A|nr:filamentous hemagglutinin N-terminal domain-containing protein [Argonema antarcticum]MCL1471929.1 filamentous hemagglutinin N-terminal domain-containing protein [Argonema antarcticum A004/B2]
MKQICFLYLRLWLVFLLSLWGWIEFFRSNTLAQIIPDRTLGVESTIVTPNVDIDAIPTDRIDGGAIRGNNLFHSFQEFNIDAGKGAYFANPDGIANILSRITGGNSSKIFGTLGVLGNANLFLINPNGIIFGPNARLDLGGSFLASTANSLIFDNGFAFSTNNPQIPPLLTVNVPIGLQVGENPGSIMNQSKSPSSSGVSVGLRVPLGQDIIFAGGNVALQGGGLLAPGGQIEVGGLLEAGIMALESNNNNMRLRYPDGVARGDISLTEDATIFVGGIGGGNIAINARNLEILAGSQIAAGILKDKGSPETQAGNIEINATDRVLVDNSVITNTIADGATGKAGDISIDTGSLSVTNLGIIGSVTFGNGDSGKIIIHARDAVSISGVNEENNSVIFTTVNKGAVGNTGDIEITAKSLSITDGAGLLTATEGQGDAGNVKIQVSDTIFISGVTPTGIHADSLFSESGKAGNIEIVTGSFSANNGAQLTTATYGRGDGGNINIQASGAVSFEGVENSLAGAYSLAAGGIPQFGLTSEGKAGNITITAYSVSLTNAARLFTSSSTEKGSGDIVIDVADSVFVGGGAVLLTSGFGSANSGKIIIKAGNTVSFDGAGNSFKGINSENFPSEVLLTGSILGAPLTSGVYATVTPVPLVIPNSTGKGGNIEITARSISVTNGALLSTSTLGQGDAGDIIIKATDRVSFDGSAPVSFTLPEGGLIPTPGTISRPISGAISDVGAVGNIVGGGKGGDIIIEARSLSVTDGAQLSTLTAGKGNAGNIYITTSDSVDISRSDRTLPESGGLLSSTEKGAEGKGGEINVTARTLRVGDASVLSARTRSASRGGDINVQVDNLEITGGGQILTTAFSSGNAGNIVVNANDAVTISGSMLGNIFPTNDGFNSGVLVRSQQVEAGAGDAGTIEINTPTLILNNKGTLTGASASVNGGNITLQVPDLVVIRDNSTISASAGTAQAGGNGGNLTINTDILAALRNSDITANAFEGDGGRVNITAESIFGTEFRSQESDLSDITASSTFGRQGEVNLNISDVNPSEGLVELPTNFVDTDSLIAQNFCRLGRTSQFTVIGRGGLPPSPAEVLSGDAIRVGLVDAVLPTESHPNASLKKPRIRPTNPPIIEAQGWIINDKGEVILTADNPSAIATRFASQIFADCR